MNHVFIPKPTAVFNKVNSVTSILIPKTFGSYMQGRQTSNIDSGVLMDGPDFLMDSTEVMMGGEVPSTQVPDKSIQMSILQIKPRSKR